MDKPIKLINQGAYGCIYHPGINCKGEKENMTFITKIQVNERTMENELVISDYIRSKIKGYVRYFAPIVKQCPVKIAKKYNAEIQQCDFFKNKTDKDIATTTFVSNKVRFVGDKNLLKYIVRIQSPFECIKALLETYTYVLKGIVKLADVQIVHNDLKHNNIMFDEKADHPIIIDFGLSFRVDNLTPTTAKTAFFLFDTYSYWSIDIVILNYITQKIGIPNATSKKITFRDLEEILEVFIYGTENTKEKKIVNDIFNNNMTNSKEIIQSYTKNFKSYYKTMENESWMHLYEKTMENHRTWDNYSVAVIYLFILNDIELQNPVLYKTMESMYKPSIDALKQIIFQTIYNNPDKRPSLEDNIKSLERIMKSTK